MGRPTPSIAWAGANRYHNERWIGIANKTSLSPSLSEKREKQNNAQPMTDPHKTEETKRTNPHTVHQREFSQHGHSYNLIILTLSLCYMVIIRPISYRSFGNLRFFRTVDLKTYHSSSKKKSFFVKLHTFDLLVRKLTRTYMSASSTCKKLSAFFKTWKYDF
jgi:hypothetical protein